MIASIKTNENNSPYTGPPGKKRSANLVGAPRCDEIHRQQNEPHFIKNGRAISEQSKDRRKREMKQRHVIIEQVTILNEPARPSPDNMKMLWFVAVEPVMQDIYDPDNYHQREKNCRGDEFARARHFE